MNFKFDLPASVAPAHEPHTLTYSAPELFEIGALEEKTEGNGGGGIDFGSEES